VIHFVLLYDCICREHTVANSDVQVASRLHPLRTRHLSLQSLLTPFDSFIYLFKIIMKICFLFLNIDKDTDEKVYLPYSIARNIASPLIDRALLSEVIAWRLPSKLYMHACISPCLLSIARIASICAPPRERISLLFRKTIIKRYIKYPNNVRILIK